MLLPVVERSQFLSQNTSLVLISWNTPEENTWSKHDTYEIVQSDKHRKFDCNQTLNHWNSYDRSME
jgi:hypothetical protein